ncbi:hypothetical protein NQD34_011724 [Periophthalmus magnuspinnatus]|nr:hypothetical protein NQD34_011724 [Periophthalmus magnuspinnatus]
MCKILCEAFPRSYSHTWTFEKAQIHVIKLKPHIHMNHTLPSRPPTVRTCPCVTVGYHGDAHTFTPPLCTPPIADVAMSCCSGVLQSPACSSLCAKLVKKLKLKMSAFSLVVAVGRVAPAAV